MTWNLVVASLGEQPLSCARPLGQGLLLPRQHPNRRGGRPGPSHLPRRAGRPLPRRRARAAGFLRHRQCFYYLLPLALVEVVKLAPLTEQRVIRVAARVSPWRHRARSGVSGAGPLGHLLLREARRNRPRRTGDSGDLRGYALVKKCPIKTQTGRWSVTSSVRLDLRWWASRR